MKTKREKNITLYDGSRPGHYRGYRLAIRRKGRFLTRYFSAVRRGGGDDGFARAHADAIAMRDEVLGLIAGVKEPDAIETVFRLYRMGEEE